MGSRYRPALEVGAALTLPAGGAAVFSQELRPVVQNIRSAVGTWLEKLSPAPAVEAPAVPQAAPIVESAADGRAWYW